MASITATPVPSVTINRPYRVAGLFSAVVLVKPFSNLFLTWGVRAVTPILPMTVGSALHIVFAPLLVLGVGMQIFWLLARMALMSVADLSVVLPVTASGYVISAVLGHVFLHEQISTIQWTGTLMIFAGAALAGPASPVAKQH